MHTAVRLAQNLGCFGTIDNDLEKRLWFSNKPLLPSHRTSIRSFIDYLLRLLDKSGNRADVPVSKNAEFQLENISCLSSLLSDLEVFQQKESERFHKLMDRYYVSGLGS